MDANTEMLNYIYQNSQMGTDTIGQLVDIIEDDTFLDHMKEQLKEYQEIHTKAETLLHESGHEEKDVSAFAKISAYMSISMKTLTDKSNTHIAQMMMQGSTMGIVEAIRNIRKYENSQTQT